MQSCFVDTVWAAGAAVETAENAVKVFSTNEWILAFLTGNVILILIIRAGLKVLAKYTKWSGDDLILEMLSEMMKATGHSIAKKFNGSKGENHAVPTGSTGGHIPNSKSDVAGKSD